MMPEREIHNAFTCRYSGLVRSLRTQIQIQVGEKTLDGIALWDTGASSSCISQKVINELSLKATGQKNVLTPQGRMQVGTYLVDIFLPNRLLIEDIEVCGSNIENQNLAMLIGMDIISLGDFAVTHSREETIFSYCVPPKKVIDFVSVINFEKLAGKHGQGKKKKKR